MSCQNKYLLVGLGAAAVAVLGVGGYLLHKKFAKDRLQEQAMKIIMSGLNGNTDFYDDYADEDSDGDYYDELFGDFDKDGLYKDCNDCKQGVDNE